MAHAVLGAMAAVGWLVLPVTHAGGTGQAHAPHRPALAAGHATRAVEPDDEQTSTGDLMLPLLAVGAAAVLATYAYVRRTRRARTRTTPGGGGEPAMPSEELDRRGRRFLVEVDDCVRTSTEELGFVVGWLGEAAARPFTHALEDARGELAAAFRLRQELDDTADELSDDDKREFLKQIVARCAEAGRRLDEEAPAFDGLRELERNATGALEFAEARFRQVNARVRGAEATLGELRGRYGPAACLPVAGHVEQAKDRLVFATEQLGRARRATVEGDVGETAVHLRAAEGAVHQADVFVTGVDRLATELAAARERLPAVLAEVETALGGAGLHGDRTAAATVADVRREVAVVPYDPLDALRRLARVAAALGDSLPGPYAADLLDGALLTARSALTAAIGFVTTHRAAVGSRARTRLAEAERQFTLAQESSSLAQARSADLLAREAQRLAWQDVRSYGNPYGGPFGGGLAGALLGGILLGEAPGDRGAPRGPACFGGPSARGRRGTGRSF